MFCWISKVVSVISSPETNYGVVEQGWEILHSMERAQSVVNHHCLEATIAKKHMVKELKKNPLKLKHALHQLLDCQRAFLKNKWE